MPMEADVATVLVVEDDPHMRDALERMLALSGYAVSAVASANEALSYLASRPAPRLILLDLGLPDIQGEAFYTTIRTDPAFADIPVVVLTARDDPPSLPGVFATLSKGSEPDTLLGMVDAACRSDAPG
jgi:CheY-like chemotaxis protein